MKTKLLILSLLAASLQLSADGTITTTINGVTTTKKIKAKTVSKEEFDKIMAKSQNADGTQTYKMSTSILASSGANSSFTTSEMTWVDQKIEEIKPQRNGMSSSRLASLKSPFIIVRKKVKETKGGKTTLKSTNNTQNKSKSPLKKDMSKEPLTLQIVLNSSALINGVWLKENDKTRGYTLTQIQSSYVVLEKKKKKIKLFIAQKSDNLNISTK